MQVGDGGARPDIRQRQRHGAESEVQLGETHFLARARVDCVFDSCSGGHSLSESTWGTEGGSSIVSGWERWV